MNEVTFTFTVDEDLKAAFAGAAKSRNYSDEQRLRDFMRGFVRNHQKAANHEAWLRHEVLAGLDAADAGDVISSDEVEAEASAWREAVRHKNHASC